jgi:hypothetical protein
MGTAPHFSANQSPSFQNYSSHVPERIRRTNHSIPHKYISLVTTSQTNTFHVDRGTVFKFVVDRS